MGWRGKDESGESLQNIERDWCLNASKRDTMVVYVKENKREGGREGWVKEGGKENGKERERVVPLNKISFTFTAASRKFFCFFCIHNFLDFYPKALGNEPL